MYGFPRRWWSPNNPTCELCHLCFMGCGTKRPQVLGDHKTGPHYYLFTIAIDFKKIWEFSRYYAERIWEISNTQNLSKPNLSQSIKTLSKFIKIFFKIFQTFSNSLKCLKTKSLKIFLVFQNFAKSLKTRSFKISQNLLKLVEVSQPCGTTSNVDQSYVSTEVATVEVPLASWPTHYR